GIPLVTAEEDPALCTLFTEMCDENKSIYAHIDVVTPLETTRRKDTIQLFSVSGKMGGTYKIQMRGAHQITNARTALTALTLLPESFTISHDAITAGLFTANWPGRLHVLSENPFILCDGAHNVASMNSLIAYLKTIKNEKSTLLLALSKTKNKEEIVKLIAPLFSKIIVTQSTHMPMDPNLLAEECKKYCDDVTVIENCHDAFLTVKETIPSKGMLCATGSLYLLGDIYTKLSKNGTAKLSTKMSKKNPPM
ncbi:TPA: hypothetical protein HA278_05885, partial [Candidatus Woesearchaeota archaeon]|nr:hypothetical protein [Candidatus Woesearchaeota archaeon]